MKKGIGFALVAIAVIVGGLSMGCIDTPVEISDNGGLTERGFDQYTGEIPINVTESEVTGEVVGEVTYEVLSEVEVITYKTAPVVGYSRCYASYPVNVAGFDTPMERAYIYQAMLNEKVASIGSMEVSQYLPGVTEKIAYIDFYQSYYQGLQDKYQKMYCTVGNKELGD